MNMTPVLQGAISLLNKNFSVVPVYSADHPDPSRAKRPTLSKWKHLQSKAMTADEARTLFVNGCSVAIIGGEVSGNTECLDFDDPELFKPFMDTLESIDQKLANCLVQRKTPSGGYHLIYRCTAPVGGNTVLARQDNGKVAIETRGQSGYFLTYPSPGYQVLQHSLKDIATITADERNVVIGLAKAFNTKKEPPKQEKQHTSTGRPGDDFNEKHGHDIPTMLEKHGWTRTGRSGPGGEHWCRPGKDQGTSATLKNGCFYVFSSNAYPFEPMQSYSAFGVYTCLLHGGDYRAATQELGKKGYGENTCAVKPTTADNKQQKWQEPLPVKSELPPVENLTEEMIPAPFRLWVMDAANRMQIPPDFIIAPLIVVCGSIIGTSCRIRPKQKDDWSVTCNLWGGIVGPPSMLKTPALTEAVNKTLGKLEVAAREDHAEKFSEYEADAILDAARVKAIKAAIEKTAKLDRDGKNKGKSLEELAEELKNLQSAKPPTERRYKTNDSSIEKIVELLEQNPRGLLYFRDELIALFKRMERMGNEQDRAFLLESWNGDGSHTDDRIGRGTVRCDNLCISLLGGIQPDKISGYLHSAISEGENDGFVQRLQLMVYPDPVRDWQYQDKAPDLNARNRAYKIMENLAAMVVEGEDLLEEPYLRFSEEAQEVFKQWLTQLETEKLANQDEHPIILEHLAKYRSLMPSIALVIHLVEIADTESAIVPVNKRAALMAEAWCQYLESHARRIYSLALDTGQAAGTRLAEKIKAGDLGSEFKLRDVQMKKWALLTKKHFIQEAIDYLIDCEWLREKVQPVVAKLGGRPAAPIYQVNPKLNPEETK